MAEVPIAPSLGTTDNLCKARPIRQPEQAARKCGPTLLEQCHSAVKIGPQARLDIVDNVLERILRGLAVSLVAV